MTLQASKFWTMPGKDTTAVFLRTGKQVQANHTRWQVPHRLLTMYSDWVWSQYRNRANSMQRNFPKNCEVKVRYYEI